MENKTTMFTKIKNHASEYIYCREGWFGNSRDGMVTNTEGLNYFEMNLSGDVLRAFEYYETDEGEEKVCEAPDLVGINWFAHFGFDDDEILDIIGIGEFLWVEDLQKRSAA
jgi:hypothetical protein